ncbi:MAG: hypothetical protein ACD_81C00185G0005 [uncultured bacterium]|uniref:Signal transduction response regulator n=2 Tax=Candidatus Wolfeibacteriota TaxID=1752735 RepID=A0A0G1JID2_9BACT|nr:MAG: hypothetical protein ACD_81C00185G0005 [uncultured bacterium]KKR12811.1 MAG: Signal transduction response regulator [Candidatus Wolfebacteria bacterium GW2011_GWC2_39_22]KKT43742.1 MAG: Signal transduction response regulator [Candidatus Wolfebacteria bacterium GW2011_GWE2_44_13]HBI25527.1 hypothetical protein [Candidatus Wolfebacteria bacterium]
MIQRVEQLEAKVKALKKEISGCKKELTRLQKTAEFDFLTGVYNRHGFMRESERFIREMEAERKHQGRRQTPLVSRISIIFIDVDNLKRVNDTLGHKEGDRYLLLIARVLTRSVRSTIDIVGRWGGDEFVIALINATDAEALRVAEKLKRRIGKIPLYKKMDSDFVCSASFGLISTDGTHQHPNYGLHELIEKADKAMYEAKTTEGKGVIVSFSEITE